MPRKMGATQEPIVDSPKMDATQEPIVDNLSAKSVETGDIERYKEWVGPALRNIWCREGRLLPACIQGIFFYLLQKMSIDISVSQ